MGGRRDHEIIGKVDELVRERKRQGIPRAAAYRLFAMNEFGDFQIDAPLTYFEDPDYGFESHRLFTHRSRNWKSFKYLTEYCRSRGIRLLVSWPPTIDQPRAGVKSARAQEKLSAIRHEIERLDIPILGNPEDFAFDRRYFLDSKYHMNATGGTLRTDRLVSLMNPGGVQF